VTVLPNGYSAGAPTAYEAARCLLRNLHYAPVWDYYRISVELDGVPPAPEWPDRMLVRPFVPGREEHAAYEAMEDAFRDVWGRPRGTFERSWGSTRLESYDPGLWFLAESGGEISGVCLCKTLAAGER
jgi:mycothiol synthase